MGATMAEQITLSGVPEGFDAQAILNEIGSRKVPVVHVARDDKRIAALQAALAFFAPDMPVITFPGWDCLPYDRVSPNADISARRMATLAALAGECRNLVVAQPPFFPRALQPQLHLPHPVLARQGRGSCRRM